MKRNISSWGRLSSLMHNVHTINTPNQIKSVISNNKKGLCIGNGRSYGDICLNPLGNLWDTLNLNKFLYFDNLTGILICEPGVLLKDIQRVFIPLGWILAVSPGTQLITVGGAIANDIHGKNHHLYGSFGNHVLKLSIHRTNGEEIECSPDLNPNWFRATIGGMGLTGFITMVTIQLKRVPSPWIISENISFNNLNEYFELTKTLNNGWEHTVSWLDSTSRSGRGLYMRGNHSDAIKGPKPRNTIINFPFVPSFSLINKYNLNSLNSYLFHINKLKSRNNLVHYDSFFYPLDKILNWNYLYGKNGFYQYQFVVPMTFGQAAVKSILKIISKFKEGSFLTVLKSFGQIESIGMLSFPMYGITLALDFPNNGTNTLSMMNCFDDIVRDYGGRIYPAKDSRMPRELFESGYSQLNEFIQYRDPGITSGFSRRTMGF